MPKLNDTQAVLLSSAAQRDGGSVLPLPSTVSPGARLTQALTALTKQGLIEERESSSADEVSRADGDIGYGLFITAAGLQVIGIIADETGAASHTETPAPPPARTSKTIAVLALLQRAEGATVAELIAATGWLPHTTRAALTGLRKKGHTITRSKRGNETCYRIEVAA